jgi:hypothetical protein
MIKWVPSIPDQEVTAPMSVSVYKCDRCGRRLKDGRWVYSRFTGHRYCFAGHCKGDRRKARR